MPRFTKKQVNVRSFMVLVTIGIILFPIPFFLFHGPVSLIKYNIYKVDGLTVSDISCTPKRLYLPNGASFLLSGRHCKNILSKVNHSMPIDVTVYRSTSTDETMIRTLYIDGYAIISEDASDEQRRFVIFVGGIVFVFFIGLIIYCFVIARKGLMSQ